MWPFTSGPVVPVLRFTGPIGMATPLRQGLSLATVAGGIERAFKLSRLPTVAVIVNSPGGSPVQPDLQTPAPDGRKTQKEGLRVL